MPAEAGIQAVEDNNNFKDLDSRFRGNDGIFPRCDTVSGRVGVRVIRARGDGASRSKLPSSLYTTNCRILLKKRSKK